MCMSTRVFMQMNCTEENEAALILEAWHMAAHPTEA